MVPLHSTYIKSNRSFLLISAVQLRKRHLVPKIDTLFNLEEWVTWSMADYMYIWHWEKKFLENSKYKDASTYLGCINHCYQYIMCMLSLVGVPTNRFVEPCNIWCDFEKSSVIPGYRGECRSDHCCGGSCTSFIIHSLILNAAPWKMCGLQVMYQWLYACL